jgi:hypothetical protein
LSSFVGHSLAALGVYSLGEKPSSPFVRALWLGWLLVVASAPDLDYVIPALRSTHHDGLRITHSPAFVLILPALTVAVLALGRVRGRTLLSRAGQAALAGLSHLLLDLLVGVTPAPLLWPMSAAEFRLPFGILPSAGRPEVLNPLFYRNLLIELGVLAPLGASAWLARANGGASRRGLALAALVTSFLFALWALSLDR